MTGQVFTPYSSGMVNELDKLELKIAQVAALAQSLRAENQQLQARLTAVEEEKQKLQARIDQAKGRVEALIQQIPAQGPGSSTPVGSLF